MNLKFQNLVVFLNRKIYYGLSVVIMELLESYVMDAVMGRSYGYHILDAISSTNESAFSDILQELGISPTTLSRTLKELVDQGLAQRRAYGRRTFYSITEKGRKILKNQKKGAEFDIDRISQLVVKRLREDQTADMLPDVTNEELALMVRRRVQRFVQDVAGDLKKDLAETQKE